MKFKFVLDDSLIHRLSKFVSLQELNRELNITPTMDTENNQDNKTADNLRMKDGQDEKRPVKKIKRKATQEELDDPLHGVKLVDILESLVDHYGWKYLANEVNILCFKHNPTMKVSLKFLRKMEWAREHLEDIYIDMVEKGIDPKVKKNKKLITKPKPH